MRKFLVFWVLVFGIEAYSKVWAIEIKDTDSSISKRTDLAADQDVDIPLKLQEWKCQLLKETKEAKLPTTRFRVLKCKNKSQNVEVADAASCDKGNERADGLEFVGAGFTLYAEDKMVRLRAACVPNKLKGNW